MYREINSFLESKAVAIVAVSRDRNAFSRMLLKSFVDRGTKTYPVNIHTDEIDGLKTYRSLAEVPSDVEAVYILKKKDIAIDIAQEAISKGIKKIWIHVKCESQEAKELAKEHGLIIISGQCFFMWAEPKGVHWIHRLIYDLFHSKTS